MSPRLLLRGNKYSKRVGSLSLFSVNHGVTDRPTRYTPATMGDSSSLAHAKQVAFPVAPGGTMPPVESCTKQDYAVLIMIGMGVED